MKSRSITVAVVLALYAVPGVAADDGIELEELVVTPRRILTPWLGVETLGTAAIARQRARTSDTAKPAERHPRCRGLRRGRRLEPAGDSRPRRRSPAYSGGRGGRRGGLSQPHEQQRVAIARAIANDPTLLLANEPTRNLDSATSTDVMNVLTDLNHNLGITIVLVTHETDIAGYARRVVVLKDGKVLSDMPSSSSAIPVVQAL